MKWYLRLLYIAVDGSTNWGEWVKTNDSVPEAAVKRSWNIGSVVAVQLSSDGREPNYTYTQAGLNSLRRYNHQQHRTDTVLL
jgi:hypothetical protein